MLDATSTTPLSRVFTSVREHAAALKVVGALACALLASALFIFNGSETDRVVRVAHAERTAAERMTEIGALPIGGAFLQETGGGTGGAETQMMRDPTEAISWPLIGTIDRALDPARGGATPGGLYPLRKAMEQLAGLLIVPLILISVLHALVTKKGGADQHLTKVGIQFFTVIFLLWAYPYWDQLLYRKLAIPLTENLTNGDVVTDVVRSVGLSAASSDSADAEAASVYSTLGDNDSWERHNSSPMQEIGSYFQHSMQCQVELSTGADEAGQACFGEQVPKTRQLMYNNDVQSYTGVDDPGEFTEYSGVLWLDTSLNFWAEKWGDLWSTIENLPNALADTFTGWMIQLMHWIGVLVIWFVWLAIIVARAFSLCLAPVAIVWGLVPGGQNKPKKWFAGHAQIALMPVAIALGLLVFWAMMVAVLATDFGSGMSSLIVGAGVKLALVLAMIATLWKSSTLTKLASGDVTEVASDFGNSFRTKTVQVAGTAMVAGGAAAGIGAGAAAKGASAASTKLAGTKMGGRLAQVGQAGSSLLDKFGLGKGTGVSGVDKAVRGGARVARGTGRVARSVWEGRTTEQDAKSVSGAFQSGVVGPMKEFAHEMQRMRGDSPSRSGNRLNQKQATRLEEVADSREARRAHREELGMGEPRVIEGERIEIQSDAVQVDAGDSNRDFRYGNEIARSLLKLATEEGLPLDISVDSDEHGVQQVSVGSETLPELMGEMEANDDLRKLFEAEARRIFGDDFPTVRGQQRQLPDIRALMEESTALTNGMATASDELEAFEQELHRRGYVAHMADAREGSVFERAVRELDPERLTHRFEDETDEEYGERLRIWTNKALHAAALISDGTAPNEAVRSASHAGRGKSEGVVRSHGWDTRGSIEDMSDAERTALRTALEEMQLHADKVSRQSSFLAGGTEYGLDTDHYLATGHGRFRAMPGSLYDQVEASKPDDASPRAVYQNARKQARDHDALPSRDEVGAETFERQLNEIVFLDEAELRRRGRLGG